MHKLARQVRFSINPFLVEESVGFNAFSSKPAGEGLSIFFELCVELIGEVNTATGFVVNVLDIDETVREFVVPIFGERIKEDFRRGKHVGFSEIAKLLKSAWGQLAEKFGAARLSKLSLALNPFRKVAVDDKDCKMIYFSEKFEFAAMHKLWNEDFSDERNLEVFGKCANPAGHGHNYVIEVTVTLPGGGDGFQIGDFEKVVDNEFIRFVDHKNLNVDVAELSRTNPTVENIAALAWEKLVGKFGEAVLHCVNVWETDKTYCSYCGA
ncbi:MAG: 6-carboxytetrahydropterin synthase [Planctomycetota bacterium]|jgi:6-pyruvoyltetrahydropterin/6-carboxytetrahydropterin synthase